MGAAFVSQAEISEGEVDTEVEGGVGVEGYKLFGDLTECVVHAQEEVEALRVHTDHPTECGAIGSDAEIDIGREAFHGGDIGRESCLGPGVASGNAGAAEEAESELAVIGKGVLGAEVECGVEGGGAAAYVAVVGELVELVEIVAQAVPLVGE